MQEQPSKDEEAAPPVADDIEQLAHHLRDAEHLEPEARAQVADLLGALARSAGPAVGRHGTPGPEHGRELVRAVKDQHQPGLIEAARERLEEAIARAETKAPVATDIVLRLIDVLAGTGI